MSLRASLSHSLGDARSSHCLGNLDALVLPNEDRQTPASWPAPTVLGTVDNRECRTYTGRSAGCMPQRQPL